MFAKTLIFLRPNFPKVVVLVIFILMTTAIIVYREPTSKVSWDQLRGVPFPFLAITEYRGPCPPTNTFCVKYFLQEVRLIDFLQNILIWYLVSCLLVSIIEPIGGRFRANKSRQ